MPLLTPPPAAPQRGDRTTFASRVDAFITWLINFVTELVALVANLNSIAAGGAYAIPYSIVSDTPYIGGGGHICLTNGTLLYLDTADATGAAIASLLSTFGSSSSSNKGTVKIIKQGDPTRWITFGISSYTQSGNGLYGIAAISFISSSTGGGHFTIFNVGNMPNVLGDSVIVEFQRTGDKGDIGPAYTPQVFKVSDRKASGTAGGTSVVGFQQRTFNTTDFNSVSGASLSANNFTLPAGTYDAFIRAPAGSPGSTQAQLYNNTDGTVTLNGASFWLSSGVSGQVDAIVTGRFTIAAAKSFQVKQYIGVALSTSGLGNAAATGSTEIYTEAILTKVA